MKPMACYFSHYRVNEKCSQEPRPTSTPNQALQPTPDSVRSSLAPASGRG